MEKDIRKEIKKMFRFWILVAVAMVAAIPIIPLALTGVIPGKWILAAPAIAIVVFGFYGMPIGFVNVAGKVKYRNMWSSIVEDGVTDVKELSHLFGKKEKEIRKMIEYLTNNRYLRGYKYNPEATKLIPAKVVEEKVQKTKCDNCGAPLPPDAKFCEHCGSAIVI